VKQYKKLILLFAAIFILIESAAVFYAIHSSRVEADSVFKPIRVIRIGLLPDVSQKYSREFWSNFIDDFSDEGKGFIAETYIAHSYGELLTGFINGSLDMIYVNPATFHKLDEENELVSIACQRFSEEDMDRNRCVLVTNRDVEFINQTKGLRLTFVDKFSLSGYIIPFHSLSKALAPVKISDWFSEITYAPTKSQAFVNMINGETDIVATDRLALMRIIDYLQYSDAELAELWISRTMPESLLCCTKKFADDNQSIIEKFHEIVLKTSEMRKSVKSDEIAFELTEYNYPYQNRLAGLKKYIETLKFGPKRSNVLMNIGE